MHCTPPLARASRAHPPHGGVSLYADPQQAPGPARRSDPPLLAALRAGDLEQRRALVGAHLQRLGFDALGYTRMRWLNGRAQPLAACTAHSDGTWAAHYFRNGYEQVDPRLHELTASTLPCVWDVADLAQRAPRHWPRAQLSRFVADLRASGAHSGLMVAINGPRPHECGSVSLRSARPGTQQQRDAALAPALALAYCVHELYSHSALAAPPTAEDTLPELQAAILLGLARGWCDKQIAAQLNLGTHRVDYHLRQLRKRFGVRNRVQLLERAAPALAAAGAPAHMPSQDEMNRCSVAFTS